jgi:hypothetical protein
MLKIQTFCWILNLKLHLIQVSNENANDTDNEDKAVTSDWIIVGTKPFGKEVKAWIDLVFADSLEHSRCSN